MNYHLLKLKSNLLKKHPITLGGKHIRGWECRWIKNKGGEELEWVEIWGQY